MPCLGPRSTAAAGGGEAQTLEGAAREWEKFRLELKHAIPGYATDVFVMLELKTISFYSVFLVSVISFRKVAIYTVLINSLESYKSLRLKRLQRAGCSVSTIIIGFSIQFFI